MKKYILLSLALFFVFAFSLACAVNAQSGSQTLVIDSIEEFSDFALAVNSGDETYTKATVVLARDLDFTNEKFVPVGTVEYPFSGVFNGGGHILSGITIDGYEEAYVKTTTVTNGNEQISRSASVGVFAYLHNASIYNLGIADMTINITASEKDTVCAGLLCGSFTADASGETFDIKCCFAEGNVSVKSTGGSAYAGGLFGCVYDTDKQVTVCIADCHVDASLHATAKNTVKCGGIIADLSVKKVFSTATLENLRFGGSIYGKGIMTCLGGICGFASVDNSWGSGENDWSIQIIPGKIKNVVTDTTISAFAGGSAFTGSVVGYSNTVVPENAYAVNAVNNSLYSCGGEEISNSKLNDIEFLSQMLEFDMEDIWCISDEKPMLKYVCIPGTLKVTQANRSETSLTVTVEYKGFDATGKLMCAVYSGDGRMLEVLIQPLNHEVDFEFASHADAAYVKTFLIGNYLSLNPLCSNAEFTIS